MNPQERQPVSETQNLQKDVDTKSDIKTIRHEGIGHAGRLEIYGTSRINVVLIGR